MAGDCAPDACPVLEGFFQYQPSREGNAVILAVFAILVPVVLGLGYRFKTPAFATTLTTGLLLEILGFSGRIILFRDVANKGHFALFLLGTVLGPTFIAAAVLLVFPHIISVYGARASSLRPRYVFVGFFTVGFVVIIVEIVGSVLVAFPPDGLEVADGALILAVGLGIQAITLLVFIGTFFWVNISLSGERATLDPKNAPVYQSSRFKYMLLGATTLLLAHSIYRTIETATGLGGSLFQNEVAFMLVSGAVPLLASILLAVFQPGAAFGETWGPTSPRFRTGRVPKHKRRPSPLASPGSYYDHQRRHNEGCRSSSPCHVVFDENTCDCGEKQQHRHYHYHQHPLQRTPTSGGTMNTSPLHESTMATKVQANPVTRTAAQASPVQSNPKNSPTFWRDQSRYSSSTYKASPTFQQYYHKGQSPKTSPTFQAGHRGRGSEQTQTQTKSLVEDDALW